MYNPTEWKDHIVDHQTGEVIQQGTPVSAKNLNNMESGIVQNGHRLAVVEQETLQQQRITKDIEFETQELLLKSTLAYPFNNSEQTVAINKTRTTLNYRVDVQVISNNGCVGHIEVYDKQVNGFKIKFTGGASQVRVRYYVQGGITQ